MRVIDILNKTLQNLTILDKKYFIIKWLTFIISVIALGVSMHSCIISGDANKLSQEANNLSKEANKLSQEANLQSEEAIIIANKSLQMQNSSLEIEVQKYQEEVTQSVCDEADRLISLSENTYGCLPFDINSSLNNTINVAKILRIQHNCSEAVALIKSVYYPKQCKAQPMAVRYEQNDIFFPIFILVIIIIFVAFYYYLSYKYKKWKINKK